MKIEVNITKKYAFLILGVILIVGGIFFVNAYESGGPASVVGHDFPELEGVQAEISSGLTACSGSNLAIKTINPTNGAVTCETNDIGGSGSILWDKWVLIRCGFQINTGGYALCGDGWIQTGGGQTYTGSSDGQGSSWIRCTRALDIGYDNPAFTSVGTNLCSFTNSPSDPYGP